MRCDEKRWRPAWRLMEVASQSRLKLQQQQRDIPLILITPLLFSRFLCESHFSRWHCGVEPMRLIDLYDRLRGSARREWWKTNWSPNGEWWACKARLATARRGPRGELGMDNSGRIQVQSRVENETVSALLLCRVSPFLTRRCGRCYYYESTTAFQLPDQFSF